ncbi:MAG: hypothetical protein J6Q31_02025, partial [Alistipes sp.]|nr:hypothetical protein [Alistipes sp.]
HLLPEDCIQVGHILKLPKSPFFCVTLVVLMLTYAKYAPLKTPSQALNKGNLSNFGVQGKRWLKTF